MREANVPGVTVGHLDPRARELRTPLRGGRQEHRPPDDIGPVDAHRRRAGQRLGSCIEQHILFPGAGHGVGVFDVQGGIGRNGCVSGDESLTECLPATRTSLVVLPDTDAGHAGQEASTLLARAITQIVSPRHVFDLPVRPAAG
jgi:hypothetical protein